MRKQTYYGSKASRNKYQTSQRARYSIEEMSNGFTRVFDYESYTSGLYDTLTGNYHSGDLRIAYLYRFPANDSVKIESAF